MLDSLAASSTSASLKRVSILASAVSKPSRRVTKSVPVCSSSANSLIESKAAVSIFSVILIKRVSILVNSSLKSAPAYSKTFASKSDI